MHRFGATILRSYEALELPVREFGTVCHVVYTNT